MLLLKTCSGTSARNQGSLCTLVIVAAIFQCAIHVVLATFLCSISFRLDEYITLADWTCKASRQGTRDATREHLPPIFKHFQMIG
jgi:hypothetical protein